MTPPEHRRTQYSPGGWSATSSVVPTAGERELSMWNASAPVVVAIDGSNAAINAAYGRSTKRPGTMFLFAWSTRLEWETARSWPTPFTSRPRTPKLSWRGQSPQSRRSAIHSRLDRNTVGPCQIDVDSRVAQCRDDVPGSSGIGAVAHKLSVRQHSRLPKKRTARSRLSGHV